jgi:Rps23 Pro-64 3,4-dihydroxylase Tpa1-like proline 4-hydroxylase
MLNHTIQKCIGNFVVRARAQSTRNATGKKLFATTSSIISSEPILDVASFQTVLEHHSSSMAKSLMEQGYYTTQEPYSILPKNIIQIMRQQSILLRREGRFEPSWSEKIDSATGQVTRFDKQGVFACEPDGRDYDAAPDLIMYMSVLLQTLPQLLNDSFDMYEGNKLHESSRMPFGLSVSSFNAKLAVTLPGGSSYPLHIDNPQGLAVGDTRKLTCILYLNPDFEDGDGGELRIYRGVKDHVDLTPDGGRMVLFWSDEIPHEVLPTSGHTSAESLEDDSCDRRKDRYALTIWIPTDNVHTIHNPQSKFSNLGDKLFPTKHS